MLQPHDPADLISKGTDVEYDPEARCPRWERFLDEVFEGDGDTVGFVRRAIGYSLTGDTREHCLFVLHGSGRNGKTTTLETVRRVLGDLATNAEFRTFLRLRDDRGARQDIARLHGPRFVTAIESGRDRTFDAAVVKNLTGGDKITARFLYKGDFEFYPGFKLWLATNERPQVDGGDEAIWARIRLIPFNVSFLGREDRGLEATLRSELPGVLAWAVRGCLEWQAEGLGASPAVERATREYRAEQRDPLETFLEDRCETGTGYRVKTTDLWEAYIELCSERDEISVPVATFGKTVKRWGAEKGGAGKRFYVGIRLKESA